jgi:hypothetical protein
MVVRASSMALTVEVVVLGVLAALVQEVAAALVLR